MTKEEARHEPRARVAFLLLYGVDAPRWHPQFRLWFWITPATASSCCPPRVADTGWFGREGSGRRRRSPSPALEGWHSRRVDDPGDSQPRY